MSAPRLAAVIGSPIGHSLSPVIHNTWAAREGTNAHYIPIETTGDSYGFRTVVDHLIALGFRGANVTIPHKIDALKIADEKTTAAQAIGAANMLSFIDNRIIADNSDAEGFTAPLRRYFPEKNIPEDSRKALVLGAGGAARAVLFALKELLTFDQVYLMNRTMARAEEISPLAEAKIVSWLDPNFDLSEVDLLVNTTFLGMTGGAPLNYDISRLKPSAVVFDIVYSPLKTKLLRDAENIKVKTVDGLSMLMGQAVPGYKAWLGEEAIVDGELRDRLEEILNKRAAG